VLYYLAIKAARHEIIIENLYLLPNKDAIDAMYDAVQRHVSVKILVPATSSTDSPIVQHASHHHFGTMLKRGIRVFMLSPEHGMTRFQQAQMYALQDDNIHNLVIRGVFDQCQDMVKAVSNDLNFKTRHHIGAVNSINWARVAAQSVYYFKAYFAATHSDDQQVSFSVPSGNFGNVCAGHIARQLGLPIKKLIVATNENDVLDEFFQTGVYRPRAETTHTSSPSMDISKASNFERFIFDLVGRDPERVRTLWS